MTAARPLLLLGLETALGGEIARICARRRLTYVPGRVETVHLGIARVQPWAVIDACGMTGEGEPFAGALPLLSFCAPVRNYPAETDGNALYVRAGDLFGGQYLRTPIDSLMQSGRCSDMAEEILLVPTYVPDLIDTALDLLIDGASGAWQLSHGLAVTPSDLASGVTALLDATLHAGSRDRIPGLQLRGPGIHNLLPPLEDAIVRWIRSFTPGDLQRRRDLPHKVADPERIPSIAPLGAAS